VIEAARSQAQAETLTVVEQYQKYFYGVKNNYLFWTQYEHNHCINTTKRHGNGAQILAAQGSGPTSPSVRSSR
jgi:hypothetical protein